MGYCSICCQRKQNRQTASISIVDVSEIGTHAHAEQSSVQQHRDVLASPQKDVRWTSLLPRIEMEGHFHPKYQIHKEKKFVND
jgi:allantoicase